MHILTVYAKMDMQMMRYFPIIPRLKAMFGRSQFAKLMTWHAIEEAKSPEHIMRYTHDSPAWKHVDQNWPQFAEEPRNIRFGLAMDGSILTSSWRANILCGQYYSSTTTSLHGLLSRRAMWCYQWSFQVILLPLLSNLHLYISGGGVKYDLLKVVIEALRPSGGRITSKYVLQRFRLCSFHCEGICRWLILVFLQAQKAQKTPDICIAPLIHDCVKLFDDGVTTIDASYPLGDPLREFQLSVLILWTDTDWPGLGSASGLKTSGYWACHKCGNGMRGCHSKPL